MSQSKLKQTKAKQSKATLVSWLKGCSYFITLASSAGLLGYGYLLSQSTGDGILILPKVIHLTLKHGQTGKFVIRLVNPTLESKVVSVAGGCGCLSVDRDRRVLNPLSSTTIYAQVDTTSFPIDNVVRSLDFTTRSPGQDMKTDQYLIQVKVNP